MRNAEIGMPNDLKQRTKSFALRIIGLVDSLPGGRAAEVIGRQSGTSVGANYRAACRAKSVADFIAEMGIVEEEADECIYWIELLMETKILPPARLQALRSEADELVAIMVSSIKTAKANKK